MFHADCAGSSRTAIALLRGPLSAESINDAALQDPAIRALASRVRISHDPDLDAGYPSCRPARVTVTMADGTIHKAQASIPRGDVASPLSVEERRGTVLALFDLGLGTGAGEAVIAEIEALPTKNNLRDLRHILRGSALAGSQS